MDVRVRITTPNTMCTCAQMCALCACEKRIARTAAQGPGRTVAAGHLSAPEFPRANLRIEIPGAAENQQSDTCTKWALTVWPVVN
jgi:hypothetical protein